MNSRTDIPWAQVIALVLLLVLIVLVKVTIFN